MESDPSSSSWASTLDGGALDTAWPPLARVAAKHALQVGLADPRVPGSSYGSRRHIALDLHLPSPLTPCSPSRVDTDAGAQLLPHGGHGKGQFGLCCSALVDSSRDGPQRYPQHWPPAHGWLRDQRYHITNPERMGEGPDPKKGAGHCVGKMILLGLEPTQSPRALQKSDPDLIRPFFPLS